ncbi:hypothetical protein M8494_36650 [Serratia ureilytica]
MANKELKPSAQNRRRDHPGLRRVLDKAVRVSSHIGRVRGRRRHLAEHEHNEVLANIRHGS